MSDSEARAEILARIRAATGGPGPASPSASDLGGVPAATSSPMITGAATVELFAARVADYRAMVSRCTEPEVEGLVAQVLQDALPSGSRVIIPPGLPYEIQAEGIAVVVDDAFATVEIESFAAVVTGATLGMAETGTIVLTHGAGQGRRVISLLPDLHVCIVTSASIVPDVPDAVAQLHPTTPQTWISGPSATSDIELDRVEGVHGPRRLHVVVVDS